MALSETDISAPEGPLLGDVDLNGIADFEDISAFIAVLLSGEYQAEADCDENETVDFDDVSIFIAILLGSFDSA